MTGFICMFQTFTNAYGGARGAQMDPKIPYAWNDGRGNSIQFTLDSFVQVYESRGGSSIWHSGYREDLSGRTGITLLEDKDRFEQVRRITIVNSVQDRLAYYIQRHNQVALRNGVSYTFALPLISQEEWVNTMDDIGMMAFIQGIPWAISIIITMPLEEADLLKLLFISEGG